MAFLRGTLQGSVTKYTGVWNPARTARRSRKRRGQIDRPLAGGRRWGVAPQPGRSRHEGDERRRGRRHDPLACPDARFTARGTLTDPFDHPRRRGVGRTRAHARPSPAAPRRSGPSRRARRSSFPALAGACAIRSRARPRCARTSPAPSGSFRRSRRRSCLPPPSCAARHAAAGPAGRAGGPRRSRPTGRPRPPGRAPRRAPCEAATSAAAARHGGRRIDVSQARTRAGLAQAREILPGGGPGSPAPRPPHPPRRRPNARSGPDRPSRPRPVAKGTLVAPLRLASQPGEVRPHGHESHRTRVIVYGGRRRCKPSAPATTGSAEQPPAGRAARRTAPRFTETKKGRRETPPALYVNRAGAPGRRPGRAERNAPRRARDQ